MGFRSFWASWISGRSRCRRPQPRLSAVPRLEALEARDLPSTFTVTNLFDKGAGSLRAAVAAAGSGDAIDFAKGLHGTVTLKSQLSLTHGVTINGPGANQLSVSGNNACRVFDISGSGSVAISGLTITEGRADVGGGILLEGSASLCLSDCTLTDNDALGTSAGGGFGGAIEDTSPGTLSVAGSTFDGNRAMAVGPNDPIVSKVYIFAAGGAIDQYLFSTGSAAITDSTFTGNEALGDSPGASAGGGAISNSSDQGATLTVTGCTISGNSAAGADGGDGMNNFGSGQGGGINSIGALTVRNSTVTVNLAQGAALASNVVPSQQVLSNTATAGGGIFCLDLASFNVASTPVVIANSTVRGNQAVGGSGPAPAIGEGGGISLVIVPSGLVSGCTVIDNVARGGSGNAHVAGAAGVSGGIDLASGAAVTVCNTTVTHNQAVGGAGGAGAAGGDGIGGAINVGTGVLLFPLPDGSSLTLTDCTLAGNQAVGGDGGSATNGGDGMGGGVSVLTTCSAGVTASTITCNKADGSDGGLGVGGGVYYLGTFTFDALTTIKRNHASTINHDIFP
jgi:hypothetical protein